MAYSKIIIDFNDGTAFPTMPNLDSILSFKETKKALTFTEKLVSSRTNAGEYTKPFSVTGQFTTYLGKTFAEAFISDFNTNNDYTVTFSGSIGAAGNKGLGSCTIVANYPNAVFVANPANPYPSSIRVSIVNTVSDELIIISPLTLAASANNKCDTYNLSFSTNIAAAQIISPVQVTNPGNPIALDLQRGLTFQLVLANHDGVQTTQQVQAPSYLKAADFTVSVIQSPNGATATIVGGSTLQGLTLEYSIDGVTWQPSNSFANLTHGTYPIQVKDQLGCSFTINAVIDVFSNSDLNIPTPYAYISKSNSLRFAKREDFNVFPKNDDNCLSHEDPEDIAYCQTQDYLSTDTVTTQYKSNFANVDISVKGENGLNVPVFPIQKTNNLGIQDRRDALTTNVGTDLTKTGVYFISGNTYDYVTGAANGDYLLNGGVPEWAAIGNYFKIGATWYKIEDIIYNTALQAYILVITQNYVASPLSIIVATVYDRFNYNVFEFDIDMSLYASMTFQIELDFSDSRFDSLTYLSEHVASNVAMGDHLVIRYRNETNTDLFYATGYQGLLRVPAEQVKAAPEDVTEAHKMDSSVILLNATQYEAESFEFSPMTKGLMWKLTRALSHEHVGINGLGYVINGTHSVGKLGNSNLYTLASPMIKTGDVYQSITTETIELQEGPLVEMPKLITTEDGFISY